MARNDSIRVKPPLLNAGWPIEVILEFKSQRKLSDAVPTGVPAARGLNLSECALTQIVSRIIEIYVVGEIGEAAFELQLKSFREVEILGQSHRKINRSGANQRPYASVAKAANDAGTAIGREAIKREPVRSKVLPCDATGAGEHVRVPELRTGMVKIVGIACNVRPIKAVVIGISGGVELQEGSIEGASLDQENRA